MEDKLEVVLQFKKYGKGFNPTKIVSATYNSYEGEFSFTKKKIKFKNNWNLKRGLFHCWRRFEVVASAGPGWSMPDNEILIGMMLEGDSCICGLTYTDNLKELRVVDDYWGRVPKATPYELLCEYIKKESEKRK